VKISKFEVKEVISFALNSDHSVEHRLISLVEVGTSTTHGLG